MDPEIRWVSCQDRLGLVSEGLDWSSLYAHPPFHRSAELVQAPSSVPHTTGLPLVAMVVFSK